MKRRGFTLIELLVVIAIIAILAAILFPVFVTAKERGRQAKCISNLKQLTTAFFTYTDDNDGFLPVGCRRYYYSLGGNETDPNKIIDWCGQIWVGTGTLPPGCDSGANGIAACNVRFGSIWKGGYCRNVQVFNCPSDVNLPAWYAGKKSGINKETGGFGITYSLNEELGMKRISATNPQPTTVKLASAVAGRSGRVLFLIHEGRCSPDKTLGQNDGYFAWTQKDPPDAIHNNGTICSYADGHAKWLSNIEQQRNENISPSPWMRNSHYYNQSGWQYTE